MELTRKRMLHAFKEARDLGPYAEVSLLPAEAEPQAHLSRNDRPQPFYLICSQDTVLVQLSGSATVHFKLAPVLEHRTVPGDHLYVPAGTPHRIVPRTDSVHVRLKPATPGLEGVAWYCERCGGEVSREEFDAGAEVPQAAYWRACGAFNRDESLRTCPGCGAVHPQVDLTGVRWPEVAAAMGVLA